MKNTTEIEIEEIDGAAVELLRDPGVRIEHEAVRELLLKEGASEGRDADTIVFPVELIKEKLALCPEEFVFSDRFGHGRPVRPAGEPVIWSVPGLNLYRHGETRPFTSTDMADISRLLQKLDNVDGIFGFSLSDIPPSARDVMCLRIMAENTTKHIRILCFTPQGSDAMVEMQKVVGTFPWFSIGFTAHGPLRWTNLAVDIFARTAGHGIPVTVNGEPMAGVSGPVTIAGSIAVGTAEILAGIVMNQALEPGRPCVFNLGLSHTFDMRTAVAVTGGPENALFARYSAALGRYYGIPSASWVSTESMVPDAQAAMEKMFGFSTHMDNGVSNIWSVGQLESEMTISTAQAVIDDEMLSYVKRYLRGVEVNEETLAVELIRKVGIAGSFIQEAHTLENFRKELFEPSILFRKRRADWLADGGKTLEETAEARADGLISQAPENGLSPEQLSELDRLANIFLKKVQHGKRKG